jgi:hypothetical protein
VTTAPSRPPGLPSYDSYAPPEEEPMAHSPVPPPLTGWTVEPEGPFAGLSTDIPPPAIQQPPRYDGYVPPEAAAPTQPIVPPFTPEAPRNFAAEREPERPPHVPEAPIYQAAEPPVYQPPEPQPPVYQPPEPPVYQPPEPQPAVYQAPEPPPVPAAQAVPPPAAEDLAARNAELEARLAEQEEMLRRTLSLLAELVENDPPPQDPQGGNGGNQDAA